MIFDLRGKLILARGASSGLQAANLAQQDDLTNIDDHQPQPGHLVNGQLPPQGLPAWST